MPDNELLTILFDTKIELEKTQNLTEDEIKKEALEYFKDNVEMIRDRLQFYEEELIVHMDENEK